MSNPLLINSFSVAAATAGNRLIALTGVGKAAVRAGVVTQAIIGVSERMGADAGGLCDVVLAGTYDVKAAGNIAAGDPVTTDAEGMGIKAVPVAGSLVRYAGFALFDAVAGDLVPITIAPGIINTPAA